MFKRKVCKGCGASGIFLTLNKESLCPNCIYAQNKEMSMNEVANELANWVNGKGSANKVRAMIKAQEDKAFREAQNFNRIFGKYQKARKLEKSGDVNKALDIYLNLLKYSPPGSDYYVRPCIILEKKHEYKQAIEICDKALHAMRNGIFRGSEDEILHRRERLVKKQEKSQK